MVEDGVIESHCVLFKRNRWNGLIVQTIMVQSSQAQAALSSIAKEVEEDMIKTSAIMCTGTNGPNPSYGTIQWIESI